MKIKLLILTLAVSLVLFLFSCNSADKKKNNPKESTTNVPADTDAASLCDTLLGETEDRGMSYIDSFIFIGESTTYHMKNRGVLSGGTGTKQIWAPRSGTMTLDLTCDKIKIIYPETGEELTFYEASTKKRPEYVIMTFGLNGAVQNIKRGEDYFKTCYKKLINSVRSASPNTKIILQSAFPVADNMDMSSYSVSVETLNEYIDTINSWTYNIAVEENVRYLDTAEVLCDENNNLLSEYQSGDGYHLTKEAYEKILYYIRTHGYS